MKNRETFLDKFLRMWRIRKAKKYIINQGIVCDLGCGKERTFLRMMSGKMRKGIGFDMKVSGIEEGNISIKEADLDAGIPMDNDSVDYVTSLAVIEHINHHENFTQEILRILKKGGICVLTTPAPKARMIWEFLIKWGLINQSESIHEHKKYFSGIELFELFQKAGFSEVKCEKFQFGFNNLIVARK